MKLPGFSKLELAEKCQFPWLSGLRHPDFDPERARYGKAISKVAECIGIWGDAPVGDISEEYDLSHEHKEGLIQSYVDLCCLLSADGATYRHCELAFGFQLETGSVRELDFSSGQFKKRWRRRQNEIVGVIDLLYRDEHGRLRVRDYKTGRYRRFANPLEDLQLMGYGLAMSRLFGDEEVMIEFAHMTDEGIIVESAMMDEFMLDWTWDKIHQIMRETQDIKNRHTKPGMWCQEMFCPVVDQCPATKRALEAISKSADLKFPLVVDIRSDEHALYILERIPAVKTALSHVEDALKKRYKGKFLDLGDGKVWGQFEEPRTPIVASEETLEILKRHFGGEADALVKKKIDKADVKKLCSQHSERGKAAALLRTIMDELGEAGMLGNSVVTRYRAGRKRTSE